MLAAALPPHLPCYTKRVRGGEEVAVKPAKLDIEIYQGDTFELFFAIKEKVPESDPVTYAYVNLTGQTGKAQIKKLQKVEGSNPPTFESIVLADMEVTLADQTTLPGRVLLRMSPEITAGIPSSGKWDFQLTNADDDVNTYLRGAARLTKDVTE